MEEPLLVVEDAETEAAEARLLPALEALARASLAVAVMEARIEAAFELLTPPLASSDEATERYEYASLFCEARYDDWPPPSEMDSNAPNCELM